MTDRNNWLWLLYRTYGTLEFHITLSSYGLLIMHKLGDALNRAKGKG